MALFPLQTWRYFVITSPQSYALPSEVFSLENLSYYSKREISTFSYWLAFQLRKCCETHLRPCAKIVSLGDYESEFAHESTSYYVNISRRDLVKQPARYSIIYKPFSWMNVCFPSHSSKSGAKMTEKENSRDSGEFWKQLFWVNTLLILLIETLCRSSSIVIWRQIRASCWFVFHSVRAENITFDLYFQCSHSHSLSQTIWTTQGICWFA